MRSSAAWPPALGVPGMSIPLMSMSLPAEAMACEFARAEWQSEPVDANAQEMSQATAKGVNASSRPTIAITKIRCVNITIAMLQRNPASPQSPEIEQLRHLDPRRKACQQVLT